MAAWHATILCCGTHTCHILHFTYRHRFCSRLREAIAENFLPRSVYKLHITHAALIEYLAFRCKDYVLAGVERPSAADQFPASLQSSCLRTRTKDRKPGIVKPITRTGGFPSTTLNLGKLGGVPVKTQSWRPTKR